MNKEMIKKYITRGMKGLTSPINIKRSGKNEFGENVGEVDVVTIEGYYTRSNSSLNLDLKQSGSILDNLHEKLIVIVDDNSKLIKVNDYFELNDIKYKIIDLGNNLDIYYQMTLERV